MSVRRPIAISCALVLPLAAYACVGDSPAGVSSPTENEAGSSSSSSSSGSNAGVDAAPCEAPAVCTGKSLVRCGQTIEECALECVDQSGGSRCRSFDPSGPLTGTDLRVDGVADLTLNDDYVFDTDTGAVQRIGADGSRAPFRAANATEAPAVAQGIGYRRYADRAVFFFKTLGIKAGTPRNFVGALPLSVVATDIEVAGIWTLPCGRLGGGGGPVGGAGMGQAGTSVVADDPRQGGGGGAGHALNGGVGYATIAQVPPYDGPPVYGTGSPGTPGLAYGGPPFAPLLGGSRGGAALTVGIPAPLGFGEGGAALQLIAVHAISFGPTGGKVGVSVGGCGGTQSHPSGGGGGGGSGGTLLVEAPSVRLESGAILAANGGGGGASSLPETDAGAGTFDADPAGTGDPHLKPNDAQLSVDGAGNELLDDSCGPTGGKGGAANQTNLSAPTSTYLVNCGGRGRARGGGGGASFGYVHVWTGTGSFDVLDPGARTSPNAAPYFAVERVIAE